MIDLEYASRWTGIGIGAVRLKHMPTGPLQLRPRLHGRYRAQTARIERQK
jgi:hypothetical protein